jgi:hypothetical protein
MGRLTVTLDNMYYLRFNKSQKLLAHEINEQW